MNGWSLLAAAIMTNPGQPWTTNMSDRLDSLVRALRSQQALEVRRAFPKPTNDRIAGRTVDGPYALPRGEASQAELRRRLQAERYMTRRNR